MFRILNTYLQLFPGRGYQWTGRAEQMFNILNATATMRNCPPMVCKFLDNMTAFFHARVAVARRSSYLLERLGFKDLGAVAIGPPIALALQAALSHFRERKD
jgi:hypothetical protein